MSERNIFRLNGGAVELADNDFKRIVRMGLNEAGLMIEPGRVACVRQLGAKDGRRWRIDVAKPEPKEPKPT